MSNRKQGTAFERELAETLSKHGFWVHLMRQDASGQPADIIAMRNDYAYLIDCKVCEHDVFEYRRIEENQRLAMEKWIRCGGYPPYFAMKDSSGQVWMLDFNFALNDMRNEGISIRCSKMPSLERWLTWA